MAGLCKGVSVAATLAVALLAAVAQAGEDPATRLGALNATVGRMAGDDGTGPSPPARGLSPAGGGDVAAPRSHPPTGSRRPSAQTTLQWLQHFGTVDSRPIEPSEPAQNL